ncbi:hypothetical protein [Spirulina major]|uniref:hypothetical protein n=1 Tax=Spirulina major TaxID=270636 RepID=UPI001C316C72|nr:hypothetical protein [Spirulina major]
MSVFLSSMGKGLHSIAITGLSVALTSVLMPSAIAAEFADFLFIVDESGSMAGEHTWLGQMIGDLDVSLQAKGVGTGSAANRFGLVGFGKTGSGELGRSFLLGGQQFGDAAAFAQATQKLVSRGSSEDGYAGIDFAFDRYQFRNDAAVNIVLVTDEDRDIGNSVLSFYNTLNRLQQHDALLNVVVNYSAQDAQGQRVIGADGHGNAFVADGAGGYQTTAYNATNALINQSGTTGQDYVDLAWATGDQTVTGAMWDLNLLRSGGQSAASFTRAFVDIKADEAYRQGGKNPENVPEPGTTLLVTGLALGIGKKLKDRTV